MKRWEYLRSAVSAQLLVSFARERGLPEADCLRGTTIAAAAELSEPGAEIASWQELRIVRNIVGRLGDEPALGVRVGLRYHLATYDALAHAAATAATGRSAIELALRLRALCFGFCRQWLQPGASRTAVIMDDSCVPVDVARFVLERDIAAWVVMIRQVIPDVRVLRRIEFAFPSSGHRSVYHKLLESDVTFAGDRHAVTMDNGLLARPLAPANPALHRRYERECLALIERRAAGSGVTGQVRGLLGAADGTLPGFEAVARELLTGERTLRRLLSGEGTSFRELVAEARAARAEALLRTSPLSVAQIAQQLGYSQAAPFVRAFKRRNGVSPGVYRARSRSTTTGA